LVALPFSLSPEDARGVSIDLGKQRLDIRTWRDKAVGVDIEAPVAPEDLPLPARLRVAQPGNWEPCPLGTKVDLPRWPTLEDRHGSVIDIDLVSDLAKG